MIESVEIDLSAHPYLSVGREELFSSPKVLLFKNSGESDSRKDSDGLIPIIGKIDGQSVGVLECDFRNSGASFGKKTSEKVCHFVRHLRAHRIPLVLRLNSLGVRFLEGRTVFDSTFSILPEFFEFKKENLLITIVDGKALGLAALFFAQGHYRIAVGESSLINLTGPEVYKNCFGSASVSFESFAGAEHQFHTNKLIHEVWDSTASAFATCRSLILSSYGIVAQSHHVRGGNETENGGLVLHFARNEELDNLMDELSDERYELLTQRTPVVRAYIGDLAGKKVGFLVNPPGQPNNFMTVNAIEKCSAALEIFSLLKLPVVSVLDSPGGDPRKKESDADLLLKMTGLCKTMIEYKYPKMGLVVGRCFGGTGAFGFPKIFGGQQTIAVRGAQFGVMHYSLIEKLLSGTPRLLSQWHEVRSTEKSDLSDLVEAGTVDRVIEYEDMRACLAQFLNVQAAIAYQPKAFTEEIACI